MLIHTQTWAFTQLGCGQDIRSHCASVEAGQGRITRCLIGHEAIVSPICRTEVHSAIETQWEFKQACRSDIDRLCTSLKPGYGRLFACLRYNEPQVGVPCKVQLHPKPARDPNSDN